MKLTIVLLALCLGGAVVAQAPSPDATVGFSLDNYSGRYAVKVESTQDLGHVMVSRDAVWGVDGQGRMRFQLFTDGTLHLYDDQYHETVTLDGLNGQILVHGMGISVNYKSVPVEDPKR